MALRRPEIVHDGVQTAADTPNARGHQVRGVRRIVVLVGELHVMRQQDDVCGREAYDENSKDRYGHKDGPRFLRAVFHVGRAQRLDDAHVADGAKNERDEEEKRRDYGEEIQVILAKAVDVKDVVTGGDTQVR